MTMHRTHLRIPMFRNYPANEIATDVKFLPREGNSKENDARERRTSRPAASRPIFLERNILRNSRIEEIPSEQENRTRP